MRRGHWVGTVVLAAAAAAVGCGLSPTGEMSSASGDDAPSSGSSGASGSGSSGGGSGSGSGSGSSSGVTKDATSPHEGGSSGAPDATMESSGADGAESGADATEVDAPAGDGGCTTSAECPAGEACQLDGTCTGRCSSTILCNKACCDDQTNGQCWLTGNATCDQGALCTTCTCTKATDCPQYWACGAGGTCTQNCDPMHLCNGGCCSDVVGGTCLGTDCASSPQNEGTQCTPQGFCGCTSASDCTSSSYGPDCNGVMGVPGLNGCGCKCNGANDDCPILTNCTDTSGKTCPQASSTPRCM